MSSVDVSMGFMGRPFPAETQSGEGVDSATSRGRRELDGHPRFPGAGGASVPRSLEGAVMTPREAFLQRVKQAVADGNRAGAAPPLPERSGVGYQGGGPDPAARFCQELAAAGGKGYVAADRDAVLHTIQSILQAHNARKI